MTDSASRAGLATPHENGDEIGDGIGARLTAARARINAACARASRAPHEVTLVAVSKSVPAARLRAAIGAGLRLFGESRMQEAAAKISELGERASSRIEWHLIGHLQSNKARRAVEIFTAIESVDSLALAERLDRIAAEMGRRLPILLEVNLGGESSKSGFAPAATLPAVERIARCAHLDLRGLMSVPPFLEAAEEVRPFFRRLRELRDEARKSGIAGEGFGELSMGMSHDFEVAIEEGATLIRIGTALFGARPT